MPEPPEEISLLDSLEGEWIKLLLAAMQEVGPAAQTLGAILKTTSSETYVPLADIADRARLPVATVRKHVPILHASGWINAKGREQTRRGWLRRTCTVALTKKTREALRPSRENPLTYGILPWWACLSGKWKMPWCARAVLSIVMARLASLKRGVENQDGRGLSADDLEGSIENMGGDDRFKFTLRTLTQCTGLTRESVVIAKRLLNHRFHVLCWQGEEPQKGTQTPPDYLLPNWDFRVSVTPASEGRCRVDFG